MNEKLYIYIYIYTNNSSIICKESVFPENGMKWCK